MGKVEGDVTGPVIQVSTTGVIAGNVKVKELRSDGEVAGEVEAEVVRISGRVRDGTKIRARSLEVSLSATKGGMEVVFGECELAVGDEPSKEAAIAAAVAAPAAAPAEAGKRDAAPAGGDGKKGRLGGAQATGKSDTGGAPAPVPGGAPGDHPTT
jgi:hypothetical protein